jgi:hypothetical protein
MEEWRYRFIILNPALDVGNWSDLCPYVFTSGKESPVPIGYEAGWAPESVWMLWRGEKSLAPVGNRTRIPQAPSPYPISSYETYYSRMAYSVESEGREKGSFRVFGSENEDLRGLILLKCPCT